MAACWTRDRSTNRTGIDPPVYKSRNPVIYKFSAFQNHAFHVGVKSAGYVLLLHTKFDFLCKNPVQRETVLTKSCSKIDLNLRECTP